MRRIIFPENVEPAMTGGHSSTVRLRSFGGVNLKKREKHVHTCSVPHDKEKYALSSFLDRLQSLINQSIHTLGNIK